QCRWELWTRRRFLSTLSCQNDCTQGILILLRTLNYEIKMGPVEEARHDLSCRSGSGLHHDCLPLRSGGNRNVRSGAHMDLIQHLGQRGFVGLDCELPVFEADRNPRRWRRLRTGGWRTLRKRDAWCEIWYPAQLPPT